jgi:hypothetical protein
MVGEVVPILGDGGISPRMMSKDCSISVKEYHDELSLTSTKLDIKKRCNLSVQVVSDGIQQALSWIDVSSEPCG